MTDTPTSRRSMLLRGGTPGAASALALVLLAACGSSDGSTSTSTSASAGTSSTSSSAATPAASGSVAAAAQAFAATLSTDQSSSLMQTYSLANAEKWSNLPQTLLRGSQARIGLQLSTLSSDQQKALAALLQTATGTATNEGWDEIQQLWNADDYLSANGGGSDYGRGNYYIAFLGTPGDSGTWELQFGGHHLALANTYTAGALVGATPSFRGVEPFTTFAGNGTSNQPLQQEQSAFAALLAGLSSDQQATAKLSKTYSDLVLKPGADWQFPTTKEGIKGSDLSAEQKALVVAAMQTYVGDIDDADAATIMAKYTSELDDTYVAFSGTTALTAQNDYIRIDGPSVWIEFSMQHGIVLSGNHPHSVWRDRTTDYGGTKS